MLPYFDIARMRAQGTPPEAAKQALLQGFRDQTYTAPSTGGVSYMLAPIHRAYLAPESTADLITVSFPHHMPYAPNVTAAQLGNDNPMNGGPFALNHGGANTGPHGYIVFAVSGEQADTIRTQYAGLLERLCGLNENWCLTANN